MSPRPILKYIHTADLNQARTSVRGGHVHFPPTPNISATYFAHSALSYDRSAIVVGPNDCALPQRHCPDRTYVLSEGRSEARLLRSVEPSGVQLGDDDDDVDETPNAQHGQFTAGGDYFSVTAPSLPMPDMTWSESEDSDSLLSPPCEIDTNHDHIPIPIFNTLHISKDTRASQSPNHVQATLAFLPHAPPERKRSPSPRGRERLERASSLPVTDNNSIPPKRPHRLSRHSFFAPDVPLDSGCLDGF